MSFSPDKVESLLSNLDSDSATGPDGISPRVLKTSSAALAHPLFVLFTLSFAQGHLPSARKSANITALHKKGAKTDLCNYRLISLLPIISKIMESIIASDIKSFLFSKGLISDHQFGFRPGHSPLDLLLLLLLTLSLFYSPSHLLKVICHLLGNQQTLLPCIKKVQKQISATTETIQPSTNHQQGY